MGSPAPPMAEAPAPLPELSDADYLADVLHLPADKTESQLYDELAAKANQLGISTSEPPSDKRNTSSAQSAASTVATTYHARTFSTGSNGSASTALTTNSILFGPPSAGLPPSDANSRRRSKSLSFSQYDKYLTQIDPNINQPKFRKRDPPLPTGARSLFSVRTGRSLFSVKSAFSRRTRWRRKSTHPFDPPVSCICCRDDFDKSNALHNLPCGHTYCADCLRVMVNQATTDESKMPPRCCTQPIPGSTVKALLDRDGQQAFLKAVVQFSTPWESRIFCPNTSCGEFIPPRHKVDAKHPFNVTCRKCRTRVCILCKRNAHPVGRDCPEDWELEAVLKIGEKSGWRRCYKCRNLVELAQGCTHMTCRCKAQFCYICGGVWDSTVGCPNVCNGEEELERRRMEEEERLAELEAEKVAQEAATTAESAEKAEAEKRSREHPAFQDLSKTQVEELERFQSFLARIKSAMEVRHSAEKVALAEKHNDQEEKTKERHTKTAGHLEDRQIAAEMELQTTLEQSERSVKIRLKHMEAYCDGLGRNPNNMPMPPRVVTERDLRELGQQYNLRDNMDRLHQSKINVLRDRQAKRMEELLERHEAELEKLTEKRQEDLEELAAQFAHEEDALGGEIKARRERLQRRWELAIEILSKELTEKHGERYALIPPPKWPEEAPATGDAAASAPEIMAKIPEEDVAAAPTNTEAAKKDAAATSSEKEATPVGATESSPDDATIAASKATRPTDEASTLAERTVTPTNGTTTPANGPATPAGSGPISPSKAVSRADAVMKAVGKLKESP